MDCRSKDTGPAREIYHRGGRFGASVRRTKQAQLTRNTRPSCPIRGKILNCLKADYDRIFKSRISIHRRPPIQVLGCGVRGELGGKGKKDLSSFDIANLRWSKVIICTDADVDGYQIRTLILTMIYRLVPSLIEEGYVYIAESPLYEIESKGKTYFAYTEPEKAEFLKRIGGAKYTIQRSKGLGENDAEMMWLTTMNPETRRLIKVTPEDAKRTGEVFDLLLGDNLAGRKEHIANHGYEYLDELDVS
ncbi:MAG: toprim domain-containing protein [Ruthenibacterium lactatiformans]